MDNNTPGDIREAGQALVEYAFLFILVVMIALAVFMVVGNQTKNTFHNIETSIDQAIHPQ